MILRPNLRVYLNGRMLPMAQARVNVFDRGLLFGDGVYETARTYAGRPFRLKAHIERLRESARRLDIRVPFPDSVMERAVERTVSGNRLSSARVRIVLTRGRGGPDLLEVRGLKPTLLVYAVPYAPPSREAYRNGVKAVISSVVRNGRRSLDPAIKSLNLLNNFLAGRAARQAGVREAVMLNPRGFVAEAVAANVFFVRRGVLCTPSLDAGILSGITRGIVLDLATRLGFPVREGLFRSRALLRAEEAFVTASTIEVLPIASIGPRHFPFLRPYTRALQEAYRVTVAAELGI